MLTKSFLKWAGGNRWEGLSIVDGAVYLRFHMLVDTCSSYVVVCRYVK